MVDRMSSSEMMDRMSSSEMMDRIASTETVDRMARTEIQVDRMASIDRTNMLNRMASTEDSLSTDRVHILCRMGPENRQTEQITEQIRCQTQ